MFNILLFLFSNNFLYLANYIAFVLFFFTVYKEGIVDFKIPSWTFFWLFFSSISYFVFYFFNYGLPEKSTLLSRFISPILLFYVGYICGKNGYRSFKMNVIILAVGGCIHGVMNVFLNWNVDILSIAGRRYNDIYGGVVSGTIQNLFFTTSSALLFYFFAFSNNKVNRILGCVVGVSGTIASIINASRTMILVTILIFAFSLFLYVYLQYGFNTAFFRVGGILIVLFCFTMIIYSFNIFGIQDIINNSALGKREANASDTASITNNLRWKYSGDILMLLPRYPFGDVKYSHYAHNLWVDVAKEAGIIPFMSYIFFCISAIKEGSIIFFYDDNISNIIFFSSLIITCIIVFFTEPVMIGGPFTFSIFSFIVGGMVSLNSQYFPLRSETY